MSATVTKRLAHYPAAVVSIGAVLSVAAHVWLCFALYTRPIGYVDPALLEQTRSPISIKRADFDHIITPAELGEGDEGATVDEVAQTSRELLEQETPDELPADAPEVVLRKPDEAMAVESPSLMAIDLPAFALSDEVLEQMRADDPAELGYEAEGPGLGAKLVWGDSGSAEAGRLLGGTGTGSVAGRTTHTQRSSAVATEQQALDKRLLEVPLDADPIDFARIALADTTALDIPQKLDQDFEYVVSRFEKGDRPGYFKVDITPRRSLSKLSAMPKDVVFMIDVSGSIAQEWVEQIVRGVQLSLPLLNEGDRFNIVMFSDSPRFFSTDTIQPATQENLERAKQFLLGAASGGATDVNAALSRLLVRDGQVDRVYELVLISDGKPTRGVVDTRQLINMITRDNNLRASIYCVAVGNEPNRELLDFLSYRNKGYTKVVPDFVQAAPAIQDLMSRLRYPLIRDMRLDVAGKGVGEVYPMDLPNVHQGERFAVFGRYDAPGPFTMRLSGQSAGQRVDFTFTRDLADAPRVDEALSREWAFWKLHHLYSELIRQGETDTLKRAINALRREYKLKTLY